MRTFKPTGTLGISWKTAVLGLVLLMLLLAGGCNDPVTMYQMSSNYIVKDERVLVLPFMDTRTFVDNNDPHKDNLGEHARDIFVAALKENAGTQNAVILTPELPRQERSLTSAEVAELGRQHGADVVVAGQIFSFTDTRAASIPPRAGMFVRVVSADDGTLLFVGDQYSAAAIPGHVGGRDLQAKNVSKKLVENIVSQIRPAATASLSVASNRALASVASGDEARRDTRPGPEPLPEPPPLIGLAEPLNPAEWDDQAIPEAPPSLDFREDFYAAPLPPPALDDELPIAAPDFEPEPPPRELLEEMGLDEPAPAAPAAPALAPELAAPGEDETVVPVDESPAMDASDVVEGGDEANIADVTDAVDDVAGIGDVTTGADVVAVEEGDDVHGTEESVISEPVGEAAGEAEVDDGYPAHAALLTGDQLAADLFEDEGDLAYTPPASASPAAPESETAALESVGPETLVPVAPEWRAEGMTQMEYIESAQQALSGPSTETLAEPEAELVEPAPEARVVVTDPTDDNYDLLTELVSFASAEYTPPAPLAYAAAGENGPVVSIPLAVEQPAPVVAGRAREDGDASVGVGAQGVASLRSDKSVRILILPYHDRENPNNLIPHTGGAEVVTTLYGTQLAMIPGIRVLWDASGQATHDRLIDRYEAVQLGKMVDADFVVRGQVVEFRRAQSVPSFYSVVISTAVLAAQVFFAEFSGVDVATEVYRVSDGVCVMSRRDRAQQKYVVQAEKTVRRLAKGMAASVSKAVRDENAVAMDPLIDDLTPLTVLTNPR